MDGGDSDVAEDEFFPDLGPGKSAQGWVQHFDIALGDDEDGKAVDDECSTDALSEASAKANEVFLALDWQTDGGDPVVGSSSSGA